MRKSEFWADLAKQFRELPNDHGLFRIDWTQIIGKPGVHWKTFATPETLAAFEALARRAGFALNPDSENFLFSWLSVLKEDSYGARAPKKVTALSLIEGDDDHEEIQGSITDPCGASAVRCSVLESAALNRKPGRISHLPNDTQNLLSAEAQERVSRAQIESEAFVLEAEATVALKKLSEKEAAIERNAGCLSKARFVVSTMRDEYSQLGLSDSEYRICICREIEAACNSLELLDAQRRLLEIEFYFQSPKSAPAEHIDQRPGSPVPGSSPESIGTQLEALRYECGLSIEALGEEVGLDPTNVSRHISGKAMPRLGNVSKYERIFSKLLQRKVVIDKTQLNAAKRR